MRRTILSALVLFVGLGAGHAATARADGLPVLGVDVGSTGVGSSDGSRYVTIPAGARTIVERVAQHGGQVLASRSVRGTFTIPAVAYDGSAGGLSADGATLVLIEPRTSFPRSTTRLLVLSADRLKPRRLVTLQDDFSFDALSPDGSLLYLIHYVSPNDPTRYLVQAYDTLRGRLLAKPIVDPDEPGEKMRGNPLTRATSADGRWAYTLYDGAGSTPFVHALDTVGRSAHCIDLDGLAAGTNLSGLRLRFDGTHRRVVVRNRATPLFFIDLHTFSVARADRGDATGDDARRLTSPLSFGLGGVSLVALAAGALWIRARQRRA
jgi:hypothetical protein